MEQQHIPAKGMDDKQLEVTRASSDVLELQELEYKCNEGFLLWGNAKIVCQYNNR